MVTYNSIEVDTQKLVYDLIKDNKDDILSCKILDGRPQGLMRLTGFPYVLVHTPERGQEVMLTTKIRRIPVTLTIEVFARDKESICRELTGQVLGLLQSNQQTTRDGKNFMYKTNSTNLTIIPIAGQDAKSIYQMNCIVGYEVTTIDV